MKPSTREWIKKAEGDFLAATALAGRRKIPLHDQVCFHCQQSAEKYLKARLEEAHIFSPKTHDLKKLLNLVLPVEPLWSALLPALVRFESICGGDPLPWARGHEGGGEEGSGGLQGDPSGSAAGFGCVGGALVCGRSAVPAAST